MLNRLAGWSASLCGGLLLFLLLMMLTMGAATTPASALQVGTPTPLPTAPTPVITNGEWLPQVGIFDGVEMVLVPPGCFTMGSNGGARTNERPAFPICLDRPYWIDRYETTNAVFDRFREGTLAIMSTATKRAARTIRLESNWRNPQRPRERLRWLEANAYCAARGGRLPTEPEWEYAGRGPDGLLYPWGNEFNADYSVNFFNSGGATADVGSKATDFSWVGAYDLSGNVTEWTLALFRPYPYNPADGREDLSNDFFDRSSRGGSWNNLEDRMHLAQRETTDPSVAYLTVGVRCVRPY
jgi:formylglycine-generating enzyme required for sulfatase activity